MLVLKCVRNSCFTISEIFRLLNTVNINKLNAVIKLLNNYANSVNYWFISVQVKNS